ncbi:MAG: rubrerythrin family protein [Candidatus Hydrothermarchaeaceae archaeon]
MTKTEENLKSAFAGESQANRKYLAFAAKAMDDGLPEIAQLFMEAAGAETTHALNHFKVMGGAKSTKENLLEAAEGENYEIEEMYPRFISAAEEEGRKDAADSFRVAMEREKYHREMFREALRRMG